MSHPVRIAAVQMDVKLGDKLHNLARIEECLREAAENGAKLVVFPECAIPGYCFTELAEAAEQAEELPGGPSVKRLEALCHELGVFTVVGLIESAGEKLFNACVLVGPNGLVARYRKVHLPQLGVDKLVAPGDEGWPVHEAAGVRVGMHICYDSAFPEAARSMALDGAELLVLPTNFPPGAECMAEHMVHTRAMENGVYMLVANRVGEERGFRFIGQSKICDMDGRQLAAALHTGEEILYADIDPAKARNKRRVRVPGKHEIDRFNDRRPHLYGRLTK